MGTVNIDDLSNFINSKSSSNEAPLPIPQERVKGIPPTPPIPQIQPLQPVNTILANSTNTFDNIAKAIESVSQVFNKFLDSPMSNSFKRKMEKDKAIEEQTKENSTQVLATPAPTPQVINTLDDNQKLQRAEKLFNYWMAIFYELNKENPKIKIAEIAADFKRDKDTMIKQFTEML